MQCSSATPTSTQPATLCTPAVSSSLPGGCEGPRSHLALPKDPAAGAAACPDPVSLLPAQCSRMGLSPSRDPGLSRQRVCSGSKSAACTTTTHPVQAQSRTGGTPGPTRPIPKGRKNPNRNLSIWSSLLVLMEAAYTLQPAALGADPVDSKEQLPNKLWQPLCDCPQTPSGP